MSTGNLELRASSIGKLCTTRRSFDQVEYSTALTKLKVKVEKNPDQIFNINRLQDYSEMRGMITDAKKMLQLEENKMLVELDPLPDGAKTHLEELWLKKNVKFQDFSLKDDSIQLIKGNESEDAAIALLASKLGIALTKNTRRAVKGVLSGECDVEYVNTVRDTKCPLLWKQFRAKQGVAGDYYWQLIAYCHLFEKREAWLDYVLMPMPIVLLNRYTANFSDREKALFIEEQKIINKLPARYRVKSYQIDSNIEAEIRFMLSRIERAKVYYNSLTYEKCMKMF